MSVSRIGGHGSARAGELALLFRDYMDHADSRAAATAAAPAPQDHAWPKAPPVKAIDNPQRGTRAFFNRIAAPVENRLRSKRSWDHAGDVVQGDIRRWNRMDADGYQALQAIPGADESEQPIRAEKMYMRRLGDVTTGSAKSRPAQEPQTPLVAKTQVKWAFGASQALRDRAQFARSQQFIWVGDKA